MKVGIKLVKVKKFGIGWCIPHRVVADNTASNRVNQGTFPASIENLLKSEPKIKQTVQKLLIKRQPESF